MKYIIEFFLVFVIIYFLWNILKRLIFRSLQKRVNNVFNTQQQQRQQSQQGHNPQQKSVEKEPKLNWDAETVDYEEVKDEDTKKQ